MDWFDFLGLVSRMGHISPLFKDWLDDRDDKEPYLQEWYESYKRFTAPDASAVLTGRKEKGFGQWGHKTLLEDVLGDLRALADDRLRKERTEEQISMSYDYQSHTSQDTKDDRRMYETICHEVYRKYDIPYGAQHPSPMVSAKRKGVLEEVRSEIKERFAAYAWEEHQVRL